MTKKSALGHVLTENEILRAVAKDLHREGGRLMRLGMLAPFFALVTPESMEQYLKEKGWTQRHAPGGYWKGGSVVIPGRPQLADLSFIAAEEGSHTLAVLYDLLPPERRGELVKAVFPGLLSPAAVLVRRATDCAKLAEWSIATALIDAAKEIDPAGTETEIAAFERAAHEAYAQAPLLAREWNRKP